MSKLFDDIMEGLKEIALMKNRPELINEINKVVKDNNMSKINQKLKVHIKNALEYFEEELKNEDSRFKSWDFCFAAFNEARKNKSHEINIDYLCLMLNNYLASWGMFRNSFLMETNYKIHEGAVRIIMEQNDGLVSMELQNAKDHIERILELRKELDEHYKQIRKKVYEKAKKPTPKKDISDTLLTKIMLGTLGCVPAYDELFTKGLKEFEITQKFGENSLNEIIDFYEENKGVFNETINKCSKLKEYPQMKIIDMALWKIGFDIDKSEKIQRKKGNNLIIPNKIK